MKLIVQIPALNEEETIAEVVSHVPRSIPGIDVIEVLLIDDGSTDETVARARAAGVDHVVSHTARRGLAYAYQTGIDTCLRLGADIALDPSRAKLGDGRIDARALRHDPSAPRYLERVGGRWMIRYRTLAGDVQHVAWVSRDGRRIELEKAGRLGPFDLWQASIPVGSGTTDYTFLIQDSETVVSDPETYSLDTSKKPDFRTPEWAKNAVWYQIMVERWLLG